MRAGTPLRTVRRVTLLSLLALGGLALGGLAAACGGGPNASTPTAPPSSTPVATEGTVTGTPTPIRTQSPTPTPTSADETVTATSTPAPIEEPMERLRASLLSNLTNGVSPEVARTALQGLEIVSMELPRRDRDLWIAVSSGH